jgi:hypothetical protein
MANLSGFQSNTTIHAAFWVYKPDPTVDPVSKEQFVEVNSIQYIEASPAVVLASITSVQVTSNVLTLTLTSTAGIRQGQTLLLSGLTTATFLNRQLVIVATVNGSSVTVTAAFTNPNYGPAADTGSVADASTRKAWLYYAQTDVSTSQRALILDGIVASLFVYDMEVLFS